MELDSVWLNNDEKFSSILKCFVEKCSYDVWVSDEECDVNREWEAKESPFLFQVLCGGRVIISCQAEWMQLSKEESERQCSPNQGQPGKRWKKIFLSRFWKWAQKEDLRRKMIIKKHLSGKTSTSICIHLVECAFCQSKTTQPEPGAHVFSI